MDLLLILCVCMTLIVTIVIVISILAFSNIVYDLYRTLVISLNKQSP